MWLHFCRGAPHTCPHGTRSLYEWLIMYSSRSCAAAAEAVEAVSEEEDVGAEVIFAAALAAAASASPSSTAHAVSTAVDTAGVKHDPA